VSIVGTQACYQFVGDNISMYKSGCVDLGQYPCLVLACCQLLIIRRTDETVHNWDGVLGC
jgi:hypothetical protein